MSKGETRIGGVRVVWSNPQTNRRGVILTIPATTGACFVLLIGTGFYYYGFVAGAILAILVDFIIALGVASCNPTPLTAMDSIRQGQSQASPAGARKLMMS